MGICCAGNMTMGPRTAYAALLKTGELKPDDAQSGAVDALQRLFDEVRSYKPGKSGYLWFKRDAKLPTGLYLHGGVGRGKSMLMDLFFDTIPFKKKRRAHFHEFMLETHAAIHEWRQLTPRDRRKKIAGLSVKNASGDMDDPIPPVAARIAHDATLICFDEFQVLDVTDAMILGRLFTELFANGVVLVATSNRHPDELYKGGLNRQLFLPFIELLKERLDVFELNGPEDYRLARLKGVEIYHHPLDAQARVQMDAAWKRLTDHAHGKPCTLTVQGRALTIPQADKGVARFEFNDLCAQPLGAADYLAIAHNFHTVLIDDIPKMGPELRNEAKRFVTLIDALYENKVKLVCSADAPAEELYPKGDGAFEFERTASRLIEMQSEEYMAAGHGV